MGLSPQATPTDQSCSILRPVVGHPSALDILSVHFSDLHVDFLKNVHMHTYMYAHTCIHVPICAHACVCMCMHTHIYVHAHIHTCTHMRMQASVHRYTQSYTIKQAGHTCASDISEVRLSTTTQRGEAAICLNFYFC